MLEAIILTLLGAWLSATLLYQCHSARFARLVWRWDIARVLPSYRLFIGNPRDFRLCYRDRLATGEVTPWQDIALVSPYTWHHALWHPEALVTRNLASLVDDLVRQIERQDSSPVNITERFVYIGVLRMVLRPSACHNAIERQFHIAETSGYVAAQPAKTLFRSAFHPL